MSDKPQNNHSGLLISFTDSFAFGCWFCGFWFVVFLCVWWWFGLGFFFVVVCWVLFFFFSFLISHFGFALVNTMDSVPCVKNHGHYL